LHGKIDQATDKVKYLLVDHVRKDLRTLKLSRHQLRMVVAFLMGHASAKKHLNIMGLLDGDLHCRFCNMETETVYHIICCCEALARQRCNFFGKFFVEPKGISTASLKDLCLFVRDTGLKNLCRKNNIRLHNKPQAEVRPELRLRGLSGK
jgi:hypothetical protein